MKLGIFYTASEPVINIVGLSPFSWIARKLDENLKAIMSFRALEITAPSASYD